MMNVQRGVLLVFFCDKAKCCFLSLDALRIIPLNL